MFKRSMSALSIFALAFFITSCGDFVSPKIEIHVSEDGSSEKHEEHDDEG